jgi:hypothetical protein
VVIKSGREGVKNTSKSWIGACPRADLPPVCSGQLHERTSTTLIHFILESKKSAAGRMIRQALDGFIAPLKLIGKAGNKG